MLTLCMERLGGSYISHPEIRDLVQYSVIGPVVQKPRWAHLKPSRKSTSQTILIRVNCTAEYIENNEYSFEFVDNFFNKQWIRMNSNITDREAFWSHLFQVPVTLQEQIREKMRAGSKQLESDQKTLKEQLLLTTTDMVDNNYPFPDERIVATKDKYAPVTENSPMFALDCEMCFTTAQRHELTRISLIREDGQVMIDTLVKPENEITNYLTRFSGITKDMLEDIVITTKDVQNAIRACLPPDAIIVGHSLEFDFRAMGMAHPYCMDAALLYNLAGGLNSKSSLKSLMWLFFNRDIQGNRGHCSVEDSVAAMDLIKLKLEKGLLFGNIRFGWNLDEYQKLKRQRIQAQETKRKEKEEGGEDEENDDDEEEEDEDEGVPSKKLKLDSLVRRYCECGTIINVECILPNCECRKIQPTICVRCMALNPLPPLEDGFDWNNSLRADTSVKYRYLHYYLSDRCNNVLLGFNPPVESISYNGRLFDVRVKPEDVPQNKFLEDLSLEILNYRLALFEMDYVEDITKSNAKQLEDGEEGETCSVDSAIVKEIDENIENIIRNSARSSLVILIFSSPTASICYLKIK
ncbi:unnamed protein product [Auanema sp. JU1783]|nr:unnamed protein product [Auanema sp. JU1783]